MTRVPVDVTPFKLIFIQEGNLLTESNPLVATYTSFHPTCLKSCSRRLPNPKMCKRERSEFSRFKIQLN